MSQNSESAVVRFYARVVESYEHDGPGIADKSQMLQCLTKDEYITVTSGPTEAGWCGGYRLDEPHDAGWFSSHYIENVGAEEALQAGARLDTPGRKEFISSLLSPRKSVSE